MRSRPLLFVLAAGLLAGCGVTDVKVVETEGADAFTVTAHAWSEDAEFDLALAVADEAIARGERGFSLCEPHVVDVAGPPWAPSLALEAEGRFGGDTLPCGSDHYWSILDAEHGQIGRVRTGPAGAPG